MQAVVLASEGRKNWNICGFFLFKDFILRRQRGGKKVLKMISVWPDISRSSSSLHSSVLLFIIPKAAEQPPSHQDQSMASDPSAWLDTLQLLPRASSQPLPGIGTICKGLLPLIYGVLIANSKKRASGSVGGEGDGGAAAKTGRRAPLAGVGTTKSKLLTRSRLLTRLIPLTRANSQVSGRRLAWPKGGVFVFVFFMYFLFLKQREPSGLVTDLRHRW